MTPLRSLLRSELRGLWGRPGLWGLLGVTAAYKGWEVTQMVHAPLGPVRHNAPSSIESGTLFLMLYVITLLVLPWLASRFAMERFDGTRAWVDQCAEHARTRDLVRWLSVIVTASCVAGVGLLVMRWLPPLLQPDPFAYGPFVPWSSISAWFWYAVLTIVAFSGVFMWLGERVRSPASLFGFGVLFVALWFVVRGLVPLAEPDTLGHAVYALLDPFGVVAGSSEIRAWTPDELNTQRTPVDPLLVANRVLWVALGTLAWWRSPRAASSSVRASQSGMQEAGGVVRMHLRSWAWRVCAAVVVVGSASTVHSVRRFAHTYPTTDVLVHDMTGLLVVVALAWIGVASVRVFCLHERLRTATWMRTANGSSTRAALRETAGILGSAAALYVVAAVALPTFQAFFTAGSDFSIDTPWLYPVDLFLLQLPGVLQRGAFMVAAALMFRRPAAVLVAAVLPSMCDQLAAFANVYSPLLRPGMNIDLDYSFMAGWQRMAVAHASYVVHWSLAAALVLGLGLSAWSRWTLQPPSATLRRVCVGAAVGFVLSHGWILYNATLHPFSASTRLERMALYERTWGSIRDLPQPVFTGGDYTVDFHPDDGRTEVRATLTVLNPHAESISAVHVSWHHDLVVSTLAVSAPHELQRHDETWHAVVHLASPLGPGEMLSLEWVAASPPRRGFRDFDYRASQTFASEVETLVNGTAVLNLRVLPALGYLRRFEHGAAWARSRYGLDAVERRGAPSTDDVRALRTQHGAVQLGRGSWTYVVGTDLPQTPVGSGVEVERWEEGGRAYARYAQRDARGWAWLTSGVYDVHTATVAGQPVEIYAHPTHRWNVDALRESIENTSTWFSDTLGASHGHPLRVVETSYHHGGWSALGGTAVASELLLWKADPRDDEGASVERFGRDFVARTWINEAIAPADVAGAKTIHSGLHAVYGEWAAAERERADHAARRTHLVEEWIESRSQAVDTESTLLDIYRDSTGVLYALPLRMMRLREEVGAEAFADAMVDFFHGEASSGPPYTTAAGLHEHLARRLGDDVGVSTLFEVPTLQDVRLLSARASGAGLTLVVSVQTQGTDPVSIAWAGLDPAGERLMDGSIDVAAGEHVLDVPGDARIRRVVLDPDAWLLDPSRRDNEAAVEPG